MANIVITKVGDIESIVYNDQSQKFDEYARNMVTGHRVAKLNGDNGVETNILCLMDIQYTHDMFDTIGGVSVTTNKILFDELVNLL